MMHLVANGSDAEFADNSSFSVDFLSDGFELNSNYGDVNQSSATYIYMAFADTREAAFFKDVTTNGNHFTPVNLDYRDSVPDVPTNNFAVMNSLVTRGDVSEKTVFSEGNLKVQGQTSGTATQVSQGTMQFPATGKYYFEVLVVSSDSSSAWHIGIGSNYSNSGIVSDSDVYYREDGQKRIDGTNSAYGASYTAGDIIGVSVNLDDDEVKFFKNNSSQGVISHTLSGDFIPMFLVPPTADQAVANFGQDSSFAGNKSTAPTPTQMATVTAVLPMHRQADTLPCVRRTCQMQLLLMASEYFNTIVYTGDGSQDVTGVGFSPDFVWVKTRDHTYNHQLHDSVRGATAGALFSNSDSAETSYEFDSFDSDGFTTDSGNVTGINAVVIVKSLGTGWLAQRLATMLQRQGVGTIDSEGQVNTKAGFSIIKLDWNRVCGNCSSWTRGNTNCDYYKKP